MSQTTLHGGPSPDDTQHRHRGNPLRGLESFGQSIWLDFIRRNSLASGQLQRLIDDDGLSGVTSNPSIFEKAIGGSQDYDEQVRALAWEGKGAQETYEALSVADLQQAADMFRPIYDRTHGRDGFVSMEVSPHLAHDTAGSVDEAHRFWAALDRPNVFVKIPATKEGLPAIQQLTREGININITLLFGLPRYREVIEAYLSGLEGRAADGKPLGHVASVASFFLSRIDVLIDPRLERIAGRGGPKVSLARSLLGEIAIASARVAYQIYLQTFAGERWEGLMKRGARTQKLLWASTSTKNPAYNDVKYVEALIGPDTINTLPLETLNAYRDHGNPAPLLEADVLTARRALDGLQELGIDLDQATRQLEDEGVDKFVVSFDRLMVTLEEKRKAALAEPVDRQKLELGGYQAGVDGVLQSLESAQFNERLWRKDASLWKEDPTDQASIRNGLGWLHVAEKEAEKLSDIEAFVRDVKAAGFQHVVDMGMGGSTLTAIVLARVFGTGDAGLPLTILDSTDPETVLQVEHGVPIDRTLFIAASKLGTTAEPIAFDNYFYDKVKRIKGDSAGENFVAITDPGTPLVKEGKERGYRRVFTNFADIGGRYSALSCFGLLPGALHGVDVDELLERSLRMVHANASSVAARQSPGVVLGAVLGHLALQGRDKVTFVMPGSIAAFGLWLEQLLAESTGKEGKGLIPVAGEPLGTPAVYGDDRLFVFFRLKNGTDEALERGTQSLREAGQPVITIELDDRFDLGQEFFRWEIATATAGKVLGINPFDQPNVQESKDNTDRLLKQLRDNGHLPEEQATLEQGPLRIYAPYPGQDARELFSKFLGEARPRDYISLLAYLRETPGTDQALEAVRLRLRHTLRLATTVGYGPRYLHSTGQLHKGGPNTGLFLLLTGGDRRDAPIPGAPYTFGAFKQAQALGDMQALRTHGRRALRVDLGQDTEQGLSELQRAVETALGA